MLKFSSLAIPTAEGLRFGTAPKPLTTRMGMTIGGGLVYPELNFTLPTMLITQETMPRVLAHYREIITGATRRAVELEAPGVVFEFETLPPMTEHPQWGIDCAKVLLEGMHAAHRKHGLKSVLRMTPNDTREMERPPRMRSGVLWENMLKTFEGSAAAGAELLSIESVGGKELHDEALMMCDIQAVIFSMCVLGVRDMAFLWKHIADIAAKYKAVPAGDSACGFANTAMVLAEQRMIPRTFAAVVRAISGVRSLVAFECGAVGPSKDCAYENPVMKAITGYPMALEGKTAACAHMSPIGNIAAATCDTWSNESVQNIKLLGGMAPTVYMEQLIYDCRLMNQAIREGRQGERMLQRWLVNSDAALDPQAYVLTPESTIAIAQAIVSAKDYYHAGIAAARVAVERLKEAQAAGQVAIPQNEKSWLDTISAALDELPEREEDFISAQMAVADQSKFVAQDYELA
jgi:methanol---5-hydroxybenzimidazolylcobamide Co-methyltransferase